MLINFNNPMITVEQAAQRLKLSPQRVRVLLRRGYLPGYRAVTESGFTVWRVYASLTRKAAAPGRPKGSTKRKVKP
jgi:hypothetical protein